MEQLVMRDALRQAMAQEMREDSRVFILGEEVGEYHGAYKVTQGMLEEFGPGRVIDTPITEHGFTGLAVGAAFRGLRPIVEFMSFNFSMQAIDQIINSAAKILYMSGGEISCPIVFRGPNGAAAQVGAQHSQCFASWYAHCPGLHVVTPATASRAMGLLKTAIRDPNPVVFLESELLYGKSFPLIPEETAGIPIGKAFIERKGRDLTLVGFGFSVGLCMQAAEILEKEASLSVEVIDLCSLRPMDNETILQSLRKTHRLIVVEEGWPTCGIGSEIIARINEFAFDELDAPALRVSGANLPMPYTKSLESIAFPQISQIVSLSKEICNQNCGISA